MSFSAVANARTDRVTESGSMMSITGESGKACQK